jgi:hypothetical protein
MTLPQDEEDKRDKTRTRSEGSPVTIPDESKWRSLPTLGSPIQCNAIIGFHSRDRRYYKSVLFYSYLQQVPLEYSPLDTSASTGVRLCTGSEASSMYPRTVALLLLLVLSLSLSTTAASRVDNKHQEDTCSDTLEAILATPTYATGKFILFLSSSSSNCASRTLARRKYDHQ